MVTPTDLLFYLERRLNRLEDRVLELQEALQEAVSDDNDEGEDDDYPQYRTAQVTFQELPDGRYRAFSDDWEVVCGNQEDLIDMVADKVAVYGELHDEPPKDATYISEDPWLPFPEDA